MMYDDAGCIGTLPRGYYKQLRNAGIKCIVTQPFKPYMSFMANNRDHRKITSIDGIVSFTGGVNLADEYINEIERFGHWKDCGVRLRGDASWGFTVMFLQMWNHDKQRDRDYEKYRPDEYSKLAYSGSGYVQPFGDIPLDNEIVGELVYINILNRAKDYVYINTP
ncbi:MAG: cardiolipin synthase, partial [Christensenellaceae bacterium]